MIQQIAQEASRIAREFPTLENLTIAVEINQRYLEYLEELEIAPMKVDQSVIVRVEGKNIKFNSIEDIAEWITSNK